MADQFHAEFVGFVLGMSRRGETEATSPVGGELLLLQLSVQASRECHLHVNRKGTREKQKAFNKTNETFDNILLLFLIRPLLLIESRIILACLPRPGLWCQEERS